MSYVDRAVELAADFDELAKIERVQDHHRAELARREAELRADLLACDALEAHLAQRLAELVVRMQVLERAFTCSLDSATASSESPSAGSGSGCSPRQATTQRATVSSA